jgi:hypothetical protein
VKVLLINPLFPQSLWSFTGVAELVGAAMGQAPLGLLTVAALTPKEHEVSVIDENVEPIDFDADVDLVALTAFNVQFGRAIEIAREFRRRGIPVAIGGPYVSLVPERGEGRFDYRFVGEAARATTTNRRRTSRSPTRPCRASICSASTATCTCTCRRAAAARSSASSATSSSPTAACRARSRWRR